MVGARLEPLGLGQLFDRSLKLYRNHLRSVFGLSALAFAVSYILTKPQMVSLWPAIRDGLERTRLAGIDLANSPTYWSELLGGVVLLTTTVTVMTTVGEGLVVQAASPLYLGEPFSLRTCLRKFAGKVPHLVLTRLLALVVYGLIVVAGLAVMAVSLYVATGYLARLGMEPIQAAVLATGGVLLVLGLPLTGLVLWLVLCWALVPEVVVLEDRAYFGALLRSARMMRLRDLRTRPARHLTRAAILLLAYTAIYSSLDGLVATLYWVAGAISAYQSDLSVATAVFHGPFHLSPVLAVPFELTITFFDAALQPLVWLAMLVLYYDIRVRHEGFDLERIADRLAAESETGAEPA